MNKFLTCAVGKFFNICKSFFIKTVQPFVKLSLSFEKQKLVPDAHKPWKRDDRCLFSRQKKMPAVA